MFYVHFLDGKAIRQIEVSVRSKIFLSADHPVEGNATLYDQHLDDLCAQARDFITREEFERVWEKR